MSFHRLPEIIGRSGQNIAAVGRPSAVDERVESTEPARRLLYQTARTCKEIPLHQFGTASTSAHRRDNLLGNLATRQEPDRNLRPLARKPQNHSAPNRP